MPQGAADCERGGYRYDCDEKELRKGAEGSMTERILQGDEHGNMNKVDPVGARREVLRKPSLAVQLLPEEDRGPMQSPQHRKASHRS